MRDKPGESPGTRKGDRRHRMSTEATILRGTLKSVLLTLQTASGARSERTRLLLVEDALAGLRIGLDMAKEERGD